MYFWASHDLVLIRTTWDYQDRLSEFLAWAEQTAEVTTLLNPLEIVRWNTHKSYLLELEQRGVPVVETVWLEAGSDVDIAHIVDERGWRRAFIKPAVGSTARETLRFSRDEIQLAEEHIARLLPREMLLVQPYLERVETEGAHPRLSPRAGTSLAAAPPQCAGTSAENEARASRSGSDPLLC